MTMTTGVVSIGRGVGDEAELSENDWYRFIADLQSVVADAGYITFFTGEGDGVYEGTEEVSFTVIFGGDGWRGTLRLDLAELALEYNQVSIALPWGETEFVQAR